MVDRYIDSFLRDIATDEELAEFFAGIDEVNGIAKSKFKKRFVELSDQQKDEVLSEIVRHISSS